MFTISPISAVLGGSTRVSVVCSHPQASSSGKRFPLPPSQALADSCTERYGRPSGATYERILRYPDGRERRIRYPVPSEDATLCGGDEWETRNAWKAARARTTSQLPSRPTPPQPAAPRKPAAPPPPPDRPPESIPDSPLALLRFLTSDAHKEAQRREWEEVKGSYEILQGCPWPVPRPLYVIAAHQPGSDAGLTHTLRTRLPLADVENELTRVLRGKAAADAGKPLIRCSEMVDGIVTFETEDDAEQYGELLEQGGTAEGVAVARCDSHELFRSVQGAKGAVVLLRKGGKVPFPHQLAAALKGSPSPMSSVDEDD